MLPNLSGLSQKTQKKGGGVKEGGKREEFVKKIPARLPREKRSEIRREEGHGRKKFGHEFGDLPPKIETKNCIEGKKINEFKKDS